MEFRDLKKQYAVLKTQIDEAVLDVMASGAYIMGKPVAELESKLAEYVGCKYCISCANGTDALSLALTALGVGSVTVYLFRISLFLLQRKLYLLPERTLFL